MTGVKGETESVNGYVKMYSGGWTRRSGLEAGSWKAGVPHGALTGQEPEEGTGKRGQDRRDARLEGLIATAAVGNKS